MVERACAVRLERVRKLGEAPDAAHCLFHSVRVKSHYLKSIFPLTAYAAGVTDPRVATYPGAFSSHTEQQLRDNTRKVLWPQIRKALTAPIAPAKEQAVSPVAKRKDIVFTGDLAQVNQYFANQHWTDGLPIVPPTPDAVAELLRFTDEAADGVVAMMPTSRREVRVRDVAVNGVMAGCLPEYMPVLLAIVRAMTDGDFRRTLASTHAWTPYCWLNGPAARQLGIDHEQGEISSIANARIGRFINLAMLNLGGYYVKQNRMGTFGYLMPWCLAEDESTALGIGWLPFHMQRGFQVNENTVTMASALNWGNNMAPTGDNPVKIMELMAWDATEKQQFAIGSGTPCVYRTFLITPQVAANLARGYKIVRICRPVADPLQTRCRPVADPLQTRCKPVAIVHRCPSPAPFRPCTVPSHPVHPGFAKCALSSI